MIFNINTFVIFYAHFKKIDLSHDLFQYLNIKDIT